MKKKIRLLATSFTILLIATITVSTLPTIQAHVDPNPAPLIASINMQGGQPGAYTNVGVAFDGSELYVTGSGNTIYVYDTSGTLTRTVSATKRYGAIAYDGTRDEIWACLNGSPRTIDRINKVTGAVVDSFPIPPGVSTQYYFCDGLAFDAGDPSDAADDILYYSPDVHTTIYRLTTAGALIDSFQFAPITNGISNCRNSGIAVGGPDIWLSDNGCDHIYRANKPPTVRLDVFHSVGGTRPEDMECDDVTFQTPAIWVRTFEDNVLRAYTAPNRCGIGGLPPSEGVPELGIELAVLMSLVTVPILVLRHRRSIKMPI